MAKQTNKTDNYEKYLKEYNKLAKKADRRMRELERFSRYDEYKSILNYAYARAKRDIDAWTPPTAKEKKPRWQRNAPTDTRTLKAKIADIEKFLNKKTSTVTGVKKVYEKRANTINKKYDTNFTWQQLANYFDTGLAEKTSDKYGSKTMLKAIGVIQKSPEKALAIIKQKSEDHIQVSNVAVKNTVNELLKEYGTDIEHILN